MKEKLTRNTGLKFLSLLLAVLLWVVILNVDNPVITETFHNITVEFVNEQSIEEKDKVYEIVKGDKIDVSLKGKRSIIEKITSSDIKAVADLSLLSIVNAVDIKVTIPNYADVTEIVGRSATSAKVELESLEHKQIKVDVVTNGTVAENYYVKEKIASPNMIVISGAETAINKIGEVIVEIDVANISESLKEKAVPKVYDKNGTLMDSNKLKFDFDEVEVSVNLLQTKTVPLIIDLIGTPAYGYEYASFEYEPKQVVIAGEKEELNKVQYIKFTHLINNRREDLEGDIIIEEQMKNTEDIMLIDENRSAVFKLKVEKLDSKEISFRGADIEMQNVPESLTASVNLESNFLVRIYGKASALNKVNKFSINPYINLADATIGTKLMNVQFNISDNSLLVSNPSINVTLDYSQD
jgi:YbbR domain-containing protein